MIEEQSAEQMRIKSICIRSEKKAKIRLFEQQLKKICGWNFSPRE